MTYKFIDITNGLSVLEMETATQENTKTIKLLSEEVKRLKSVSLQSELEKSRILDITIEEDITEEIDDDSSLLDEITYYYSKIIEATSISPLDSVNLKELLPSLKNSNYQNIIYGICALLLKEINEILEFIQTENAGLTKEELQEFKEEALTKQKLMHEINVSNIEKQEEIISEKEEPLNNIVFLETTSGNIYAEQDLSPNTIPSEYYAGFYELFKSIEEGTFKNVKKLTANNNGTAGISEVKGFKRRVVFDRVGPNTYVIIAVFVKKSDMDKGYIDPLKKRIAVYRKNRETIVEKTKDSEYMLKQKEILNRMYETLKPKEDAKSIQKELK